MKTDRAKILLRCLRQAAPDSGLTDGQLLARYVARRDDDAFEALVRRHGPMVLGVCGRVLRHAQDAEDAFQATFLVLARRAAAVAGRAAVGGWLHTVAYHAALAARASGLRRKAKERQVEDMPHPVAPSEEDQREMLERLDRELARLPEMYRLPVVLCELEGRSRREAARELGLPEGTLSSRLATARKTLAGRLSRGGTAVSAVALGMLLTAGARAACVPGRLLLSTARVAGGGVPVRVAALTEGVMKSMLLTKLKATVWGLLLAASISVGAVALTYRPAEAQSEAATPPPVALLPPPPAGPAPVVGPAPAAPSPPSQDELEALRLEVEALRLDLKATKERVTVLENQARPPAGRAGPDNPPGGIGDSRGGGIGIVPTPAVPGPKGGAETPGDLDAAMQRLRQHPDDKPALEALHRAIQRLKDEADQFKDKVKEKCNEAWKLEQFEQAIQRLNELTPPALPGTAAPPAPRQEK